MGWHRRAGALIATIVAIFCAASVAAQSQYRVVDVGSVDQAGSATCNGPVVNQSGQAAALVTATIPVSTALLNPDGTRVAVGSLFGNDTWPSAINASGQIIGISAVDGNDSAYRGFLWTRDQGIRDITGASSWACGINSAGDVVGMLWSNGHGYLYSGGVTYDLNNLAIQGGDPWQVFGEAFSINDAGEIYGTGVASDGTNHAYFLIPTVSSSSANLLLKPGFEEYAPPTLGAPGWVSDPIRQIAAKSETNQPHSGAQNGACWATTDADCGMYQDVTAPATGTYALTAYANADRPGGFVGANVNGTMVAWQGVDVRGFGNYGAAYTMTFTASQGDTVRVWMYSPPTPGYVVIDDVSLTVQ